MPDTRPARGLLISAALALLAALACFPFDAAISDWFADSLAPDGTAIRRSLKIVQRLRDGLAISLYALALAYVSYSVGRGWKPLAGAVVAALVASIGLHACKFTVGRARPELGLGPYHYAPFSLDLSYDSFPSAHAATAILIVLLLTTFIPLRGRWRWLYLPLALFVLGAGAARIAQRRHFASDVAVGFAFACLALWLAKRILSKEYLAPLTRGGSEVPRQTREGSENG